VDSILLPVTEAVEQLFGRASGPFHLRLIIQPCVAAATAVRAAFRDVRENNPPFFWAVVTQPEARKQLIESGWKDIGKVFVLAVVLDCVYQLVVLRDFHVLQTLIVALVVAVLPYLLVRGPAARFLRRTKSLTPAGSTKS
jgi:hypothetical protein